MKRLKREKKRMTKNHFNNESAEQKKRKEKDKKKWKEGREYNLMRKTYNKTEPSGAGATNNCNRVRFFGSRHF